MRICALADILSPSRLTFAAMIWGVSSQGWWMDKMGALFFGSAIVIGLVGRLGEKKLTGSFVDGARDLLGVALVVGLARGIVVIMDNGLIADTILHGAEQSLGGLGDLAFINLMFWIEVGMSFFVPSSSGEAALTMPVLAPLGDLVGVNRQVTVLAFQFGDGFSHIIYPTSASLMATLGVCRVDFRNWLKVGATLLGLLFIMSSVVVIGAQMMGYH